MSQPVFLPFAAPSTGAFTGQIGKIADLHAQHPQGEEQRLFRVNSPSGVRQGSRTLTKGQESLSATSGESDKFAWSKFEQPTAGPQGENQGGFS